MPQLCQAVPYELQRLFDKKQLIENDLAKTYFPNSMAYLRLKLSNVEKEIREYKRRN